jgi:hypothetical protein
MFENIWRDMAMAVGFFHVVGPVVVRSTFRATARCKPVLIPLDELTPAAMKLMAPRIPEMQALGFEWLGCYDCGELTNDAKTYVAYFLNRNTNDFANVTLMMSPGKMASYFEFSTKLSNGMTLETNTNGILPLTPDNPEIRVFRFHKILQPQALFEVHQQLLAKYAAGFSALGEPKGQEIERMVRVVQNYGARHTQIGYMYLAEAGESYRLTWKGAILMTWRALWPTVFLRKALYRQEMRSELRSLQVRGATALQKA